MSTIAKILVVIGAFALWAPAAPARAAASPTPSYARPAPASDEETIHGRILSFNGQYDMQVRDDRGFVDHVRLHQGTVINPVGLTLTSGMSVTMMGYARGDVFQANEIDTPYSVSYPVPVPVYGSPYYPYYPYYGSGVIIAPEFGWGWHHHGWRR
jgi:hypothetical protein